MSRQLREPSDQSDLQGPPYLSQVSAMVDPRCARIRLSRELPSWFWSILAFSLSLRPDRGRSRGRLIVGTLLYVLTLMAAVGFMTSSGFYLVFDILSNETKSTVFTGTADLLLGLSWASIGTYANHLAFRVITTHALSSNIYLHSRNVLRINSSILIFIVAVGGMIAHMYHYKDQFKARECSLVGLYPFVCKIRFISGCIYACFAVYWNLIVACFILSLCRTHTIRFRRFVRELEFEGKVLEKIYALRSAQRARQLATIENEPVGQAAWDAPRPSDFMEEVETDEENITTIQPPQNTESVPNDDADVGVILPPQELLVILRNTQSAPATPSTPSPPLSEASVPAQTTVNLTEMFRRLEAAQVTDIEQYQRILFTCEDLCMKYWRIGCQLRITSLVFQRWMATWLMFSAIWALSYIVHWLTHKATFLDLLDFFIPVILIGLICSAYAEVNLECSRIGESVCPQPDRLYFNRFLTSQPINLYVYSMPMNYQVIAGFIAAFAIAFLSRIVMDEFNKS